VTLPNATLLTDDQRQRAAWRIKHEPNITPWPDLKWWNDQPCARHAPERNSLCKDCGIVLFKHQRVGAAWLYLGGKGLDGDTVGSGKTATILAMLAMCKEHGELGPGKRAVVVCQASAVEQWGEQVRRLLPNVPLYVANGPRDTRYPGYAATDWDIAIVSDRTFCPARGKKISRDGDIEVIRGYPVHTIVADDLDALRNHETATYWAFNQIAVTCKRVINVHATSLQKRLTELWCNLAPVGGRERLGTLEHVRSRYVTKRRRIMMTGDPNDRTGRRPVRRVVWEDSGLNSRPAIVREFRRAIAPLILRRTAKDLAGDLDMPAIQYAPTWVDLLPKQRDRYEELRAGVLRRLVDGKETVSYTEAAAAFTRGWQICSGLAALDGPVNDVSAKFDWTIDKLTGDLDGEKAVCFVYFRDNVAALSDRLKAVGIKHVLFWSAETDPKVREARRQAFLNDPETRVLIGTTTIERSLNLQAAQHLIAVDTVLNPQRMAQIIGRVRRQGSQFGTIFVHHLLARATQEEGYLPLLRQEEAMASMVWGEKESEIFNSLSARDLLQLVARGQVGRRKAA
jgi:SNF2 family DNA or RNA helicase